MAEVLSADNFLSEKWDHCLFIQGLIVRGFGLALTLSRENLTKCFHLCISVCLFNSKFQRNVPFIPEKIREELCLNS